jgi:hypothetical protein
LNKDAKVMFTSWHTTGGLVTGESSRAGPLVGDGQEGAGTAVLRPIGTGSTCQDNSGAGAEAEQRDNGALALLTSSGDSAYAIDSLYGVRDA